jgi:MoaA/NifB/PqqE/SkfB family radical SAM enzyme
MKFSPKEVLFSPVSSCNLSCSHCVVTRSGDSLPARIASRFLKECKAIGVKRVGFTGGEPFLAPDFLYALTRDAVKNGMLFDRIMTNGVWYKDRKSLAAILSKLRDAGYDGDICVSLDAFHSRNIKRIALFIETALSIWRRPDMISIASVTGAGRDAITKAMMKKLSRLLGARLSAFDGPKPYIRREDRPLFTKILKIKMVPLGQAKALAPAWGKRWFNEDHCKGPGDIFFVEPSGDVKPCCGYATDSGMLTIGNIRRHSASDILRSARANRFVSAVFGPGLSRLRVKLEKSGYLFPGKTDSHCYFCDYITEKIPGEILAKCLDRA